MALPNVETGVMEMIAEEEANEKREAALAAVNSVAKAETASAVAEVVEQSKPATEVAAVAPVTSSAETAIAVASHTGASNPLDFLAEQGISGLKLDFTSFPTVTLNNGSFSTDENKNFGTSFEFVYMDKRETFLFKADRGRDQDPYLVYSDDGLVDNKDGLPIAEIVAKWRAEGLQEERKPYTMVIATAVGGPHDGEIVQLQIPPTSQGKLSGYIYSLGFKKVAPREVVTVASIGAEVGSGLKAFTPWVFKQAK